MHCYKDIIIKTQKQIKVHFFITCTFNHQQQIMQSPQTPKHFGKKSGDFYAARKSHGPGFAIGKAYGTGESENFRLIVLNSPYTLFVIHFLFVCSSMLIGGVQGEAF